MQIKQYSPAMTKEEMELVHEKALYLLEHNGHVFECDEAIEIFKNAGYKVDGYRVYFDPKRVEEAIAMAPKKFELYGRGGALTIGDGTTKRKSPLGSRILDGDTYRSPTVDDYINFVILNETNPQCHLMWNALLVPRWNDSVSGLAHAKLRTAITLAYGTKPIFGLTEGREVAEATLEMHRTFYGLSDNSTHYAASFISSASPFQTSAACAETQIVYARAGQIVRTNSAPMPGLVSPQPMASLLVQATAEKLAGLTFTQTINPGTPHIFSTAALVSDLRYPSATISTPQSIQYTHAARDMANFYGLPVAGGAVSCDGKLTDYQSGAESFMNIYFSQYLNHDITHVAFGSLDGGNGLSYEKYILDEEIYRMVASIDKPVAYTEDRIQMDKMLKAGPGGNFLERTSKIYREEYYLSNVFTTAPYGDWVSAGSETVNARARKICDQRIATFKATDFDSVQRKIIDDCIPKEYQRF